jgi:anti-sigma B factor antagonist
MPTLSVERTSDGEVEVVAVTGEIDIASAPRLITGLNDAVGNCETPVVVDLSAVDFMDSTGLALLLNAHRRLSRRGKGFAVVCADGPVRRVFTITDMVDVLQVRGDVATARKAALEASTDSSTSGAEVPQT